MIRSNLRSCSTSNGARKDPFATTGVNQYGVVFTPQVWIAEPIDWATIQTAPDFSAEDFAAFNAAGGNGVIITGVVSEAFTAVPIRGLLVSFIDPQGQPLDLFVVTERVEWSAAEAFPARGQPGLCICPGCPCVPPLSSDQEAQYCGVYCGLQDAANQAEDEEARKLFKCGLQKSGTGLLGLFADCVLGVCTAPAGGLVPALGVGAAINADTVKDIADCRAT